MKIIGVLGIKELFFSKICSINKIFRKFEVGKDFFLSLGLGSLMFVFFTCVSELKLKLKDNLQLMF